MVEGQTLIFLIFGYKFINDQPKNVCEIFWQNANFSGRPNFCPKTRSRALMFHEINTFREMNTSHYYPSVIYTGFPQLLEMLEKLGIYFDSLSPGNSLEFCVKTLNPLEICERHKK